MVDTSFLLFVLSQSFEIEMSSYIYCQKTFKKLHSIDYFAHGNQQTKESRCLFEKMLYFFSTGARHSRVCMSSL